MVEVGPKAVVQAAGFDFAGPYANEVPAAMSPELDLVSRLRQCGSILGQN
jgi:hypothetical protein